MKFHKPTHGPSGQEAAILSAAFERYAFGQVEYATPDWSTWFADLLAMGSGADSYDIIYVPGGWIPALARKGLLEDLQSAGSAFVNRLNGRLPSAAIESGYYRGVQYGLPVYGAVWSFLYNKDILLRVGYEQPPATWEQLKACAMAIQEQGLTRYAYGLNDDSDGHFIDHGYVYLLSGGSSEWSKSDRGLAFLQEMIRLGWCNIPANSPSTFIRDQFFAGDIAMTVGPSDWLLHRQQHAPEFPLGVSLVPYPADGRSTAIGSYGCYCLVKSKENNQDRMDLLEYLLDPALLDRHVEGIGMLPLHQPISAQADPALSVFRSQLLHYSQCFPAMEASDHNHLTGELLSCLRLEKSPQAVIDALPDLLKPI